jgi:hypothetical protein
LLGFDDTLEVGHDVHANGASPFVENATGTIHPDYGHWRLLRVVKTKQGRDAESHSDGI